MRHPATGRGAALRRPAYTLIELLVVLAIIAVLASLTTAAAMMMISSQHERNTKFSMRQIEGERKKHWDAVVQSALKENMDTPDNAAAAATIRQWAGGDEKRARVMYVKFRLKQEFPTSFAEALNPFPMPAKKNYTKYLNSLGITTTTNPLTATPAAHESAACLYMALSEGTSGVKTNLDQLNVGVKSFDAPGGQTIKALVDDWGNPLVFARWPTGDANLDALTPLQKTKTRDLEDPEGLLINSNWWGQASTPQNPSGRVQFETYAHTLTKNNAAHEYYMIPVLVSGGRDGKLGVSLDGKLTVTNAADAKDNLYSYNLERE
jgi:prepilin-type N-terminal cleavage/methylation domain-containing protein